MGILSAVLVTGVSLGAKGMTIWDGELRTSNPIYSAPIGESYLMAGGAKNVTLTIKASKTGYQTNSASRTWTTGDIFSVKVKGPTYTAAGTTFTATNKGTDCRGEYHSGSASYTYR